MLKFTAHSKGKYYARNLVSVTHTHTLSELNINILQITVQKVSGVELFSLKKESYWE